MWIENPDQFARGTPIRQEPRSVRMRLVRVVQYMMVYANDHAFSHVPFVVRFRSMGKGKFSEIQKYDAPLYGAAWGPFDHIKSRFKWDRPRAEQEAQGEGKDGERPGDAVSSDRSYLVLLAAKVAAASPTLSYYLSSTWPAVPSPSSLLQSSALVLICRIEWLFTHKEMVSFARYQKVVDCLNGAILKILKAINWAFSCQRKCSGS